MVLGSEVFYDEGILADIAHVLEQVLTPGGKGFFCDPIDLGWIPSNSDSKRSLSWQSKKSLSTGLSEKKPLVKNQEVDPAFFHHHKQIF